MEEGTMVLLEWLVNNHHDCLTKEFKSVFYPIPNA